MRVVYSCVVDRGPKFFRQGLNLVHSLIAVGVKPENILVNLTPPASIYRPQYERLGCLVKDTIFFADKKYSNKVAQLRNAPRDVDFVVCCDTDILYMRNIEPDLRGKEGKVLGKVVDYDNPPIQIFRDIAALDPALPEIEEVPSDVNRQPTFSGNFNGGLYIIPGVHVAAFSEAWEEEALRLFHSQKCQEILGSYAWHIDQISFCFALAKLGLDYEYLPITFNFPLHMAVPEDRVTDPSDLKILHYHTAVEENGLPTEEIVVGKDLKLAVNDARENMRTLFYLDSQSEIREQMKQSKFTFLMGFHRSGTSLLTSGCEKIGYSVGNGGLLEASYDNPKGYYENRTLVRLNDLIMKALDSDWDDIFFSFDGRQNELLNKFAFQIEQFYRNEFLLSGADNYILKDPRTMQTYIIWKTVCEAVTKQSPEIVFVYRNPLECAESQEQRHKKSFQGAGDPFHFFGRELKETLLLWYVYTARFFSYLENEPMIVASYTDLIENPRATMQRISNWSGMSPDESALTEFEADFFDKDLRHHSRSKEELRKHTLDIPYVYEMFESLETLSKKPFISRHDIREFNRANAQPFAELLQYKFLGRLFSVPKRQWIHEKHMRQSRSRN